VVQKVLTLLQDDIDGSEAQETVEFSLDGVTYQIDLNEDHAAELRALFSPFLESGRRIQGRRSRAVRVKQPTTVDMPAVPAAVRAWATANKIPVPTRGRIPAAVTAQFHEAGH
jgi:hypothetical protein